VKKEKSSLEILQRLQIDSDLNLSNSECRYSNSTTDGELEVQRQVRLPEKNPLI
jgi:hypothetical protein